jgi:hypothetical protein
VVLQLDEKRPRLECALHAVEHGEARAFPLLEHLLRHDAPHTARESNEPARLGRDGIPAETRRRLARLLDLALGNEADEVFVALLVPRQEDQVVDGRAFSLPHVLHAGDVDLAPQDGPEVALFARLVKLQRAEHVGVVGHRDAAHPELLGPGDQGTDANRTVQEGVLRVNVKVDVLGHCSPSIPPRRGRSTF